MNNSGWILLDSAEQMFKLSKERVYNSNDGKSISIVYKNKNSHINLTILN